jgi:hypothetical protein
MGLKPALARIATRHAHVLIVEVPGHWLTRVAVERNALARGWRLALSPADADVLAVCGTPGPTLTQAVSLLWNQMPGPRTRIDIASADAALPALDAAAADLLDTDRQQADSRDRPHAARQEASREPTRAQQHTRQEHGRHGGQHPHAGQPGTPSDRRHDPDQKDDTERGHPHEHDHAMQSTHADGNRADQRVTDERTADQRGLDHGAHPHSERGEPGSHDEMAQAGHAGHDEMTHAGPSGEMAHRGHGSHGAMSHAGMGHGHMDMAPGGIPLARGGEDRDGLEMDLLHIRLGPVLAYWPAGLILRCTLQGDVIANAETTFADPHHTPATTDSTGEDPRLFAARRCDNAASLLALAGWEDAATRARGLRDMLLGEHDGPADVVADLDRLRRQVRRSWLLRWSLRRVGRLNPRDLTRTHLPSHLQGDCRDRLLTMLDRAAACVAGGSRPDRLIATPAEAITELVRGWDLATARLIIASLDLDPRLADRELTYA